jgi:hypothetical protein
MATSLPGRRRDLRARFSLDDNGLERLVIPGADPARNPPDIPLPASGIPARIANRVVLLRFVTADGVDALTSSQVSIAGATHRWMIRAAAVPTLPGLDAALTAGELAWFGELRTRIEAQPGDAGSWLIVHTEAPLPPTVSIQIRESDTVATPPEGFEPRLSSSSVTTAGVFTAVATSAWLNGISYAIVVDEHPLVSERLRQRIVLLCFENAFAVSELVRERISIEGGVRVPTVDVRWVWPLAAIERVVDHQLTSRERNALEGIAGDRASAGDLARWLVVCTEERGDFSPYVLRISGDPRFDALLSTTTIEFKIGCSTSLDCRVDTSCASEPGAAPVLDYMTRDFAGFRRLLLERLSVLGAADAEQNPAGLWSVLVELIAARADQLAYAQDAVATESYLHTARKRSSVRRHVRQLDYRLHEGVNARVWVHVSAAHGVDRTDAVPVGALLVTRLPGADAVLAPAVLDEPLSPGTEVFSTILPLRRLSARHNAIAVYAWGEDDLCLKRGTTRCTLHDPGRHLDLRAGDVILFESVASASTGRAEDADPSRRHAARLVSDPVAATDSLFGEDVIEVEWHVEDALPFDLDVRQRGRTLAVVRGNMLLAAHGRPASEVVTLLPWGSRGRLYARLQRKGLTWATATPVWNGTWSASSVVAQLAADALPDIVLLDRDEVTWRPQRDLLASDRSAAEFWVEMESDGSAWIRFGDGTIGRAPSEDARFVATYHTGNGAAGNVGAGAIAHVVSLDLPASAVLGIRNPLPASGGLEPETIEHARAAAPYAFRRQERAVTLEDWAEVAQRSDDVQRAVATLRWSGSWHTVRVHVDRVEGRPADAPFVDETTARLDRYRLAGYDLEVVGPTYVPLDIILTVCAAPEAWREAVQAALIAAFGTSRLPDGTRAFFHPDNYTFGDSVFLSQIVARAMAIPGVSWVDTRRQNPKNRFRRWSSTSPDALETGVLRMGTLEIARCDSNPSAPERGRILFHVDGGS